MSLGIWGTSGAWGTRAGEDSGTSSWKLEALKFKWLPRGDKQSGAQQGNRTWPGPQNFLHPSPLETSSCGFSKVQPVLHTLKRQDRRGGDSRGQGRGGGGWRGRGAA